MLHFVVFGFFGWKIVVHFLYLFIYFHQLIRCERARGLITTQTKLYIHVCQLGLANPRAHARIIYVYKLKHNKIERSKCKNISAIIKIVVQNRSCNRCALLQLLAQSIESNRLHFPHLRHHPRIMITENAQAHAHKLHEYGFQLNVY